MKLEKLWVNKMNEFKTEFKVETDGSKINIYKSELDNSCNAFMLDTNPFNKVIEEYAKNVLDTQNKVFLEAFGLPYSKENIDKINKLLTASLNNSLKDLSEKNLKLENEIKLLKSKLFLAMDLLQC